MSLSVKPEDGEAVLFGKAVNELQSDVVVELVGGTKGPVALDDDMNIVLLIKNKDTQSIKVTTTHNEESITKTYGLSGLTLETE
jgi:hypothetical protein